MVLKGTAACRDGELAACRSTQFNLNSIQCYPASCLRPDMPVSDTDSLRACVPQLDAHLLCSGGYLVSGQVGWQVDCAGVQVFVANPNKTRPIIEILVGNRDKLLKYLTDFHSDKGMLFGTVPVVTLCINCGTQCRPINGDTTTAMQQDGVWGSCCCHLQHPCIRVNEFCTVKLYIVAMGSARFCLWLNVLTPVPRSQSLVQ